MLSRVFRAKFVAGLRKLHRGVRLVLSGPCRLCVRRRRSPRGSVRYSVPTGWSIPNDLSSAENVLHYLGAYTHRVAISNHRLVALADGYVPFRWRDSAHKNKQRLARLPVAEFLRRFFLHALPPTFVRIRYFGFLAPLAWR